MPKAARHVSALAHRATEHKRWSADAAQDASTLSTRRHHHDGRKQAIERVQRQQDTPGAKTRPRATLTTALEWTEVGLQHYDRATSRWTRLDLSTLPDRAPHFTDSTSTLRLMTYNTYSCDPSHTQSQTRALLAVLEQARADIIALQEVSDGFFRALQNWAARDSTSRRKDGGHEWVMTAAQDFWHAAGPNAAKGPRRKKGQREACLLLLRRGLVGTGSTVRIGRLDKAKDEGGKAALALSLVSDGQEKLRLVTSHFSALPQNATLRERQFRSCYDFLARPTATSCARLQLGAKPPLCVFLGDTNASASAELDLLYEPPLSLVDAMHASADSLARQRDARNIGGSTSSAAAAAAADFRVRPTFGHLYPYVTASSRGRPRKPRRIDRIYLSSHPLSASPPNDRSETRDADRDAIETPCGPSSAAAAAARVEAYFHLGQEPLVGRDERDRLGKDGRRYASDHEAVCIDLSLS
ncbi:hypothetical protein BMF94_3080 [Rhodotorula taiwanensis]|uniref:Endonuclease/exonuclease/phosphatase domain-containing protein n=1 Tax=Rhodotorula taiwanensis TaxID=741276 RepID=A0A2S5BAV6_9BASI|nr:hypothetical protein BMF94_3080 [Rhodotorula taiwanensis]